MSTPADTEPVTSMDDYRQVLAEIRSLRGRPRSEAEERRLDRLEAAAADYGERLKAAPLEKGRPPGSRDSE